MVMTGDCIETPHGSKDRDGYPIAKYKGKRQNISRIVMVMLYGEAALKGQLVCHTCGNRACVNPEHLYLGTAQTNSDDKYKDGTMAVGELNGRWRHDVETQQIIHMYDKLGFTQADIAAAFAISQSAVSKRIRKHKEENL